MLSVQFLLGHEKLDTTLGYARLYDGTVAADYYRAMAQVEGLFDLCEKRRILFTPVEIVALLDSLSRGTGRSDVAGCARTEAGTSPARRPKINNRPICPSHLVKQ